MIKKILRSIIGAPTPAQKQLYRYNRDLAKAVHEIERGKTNARTGVNTIRAWNEKSFGGGKTPAQEYRDNYEF